MRRTQKDFFTGKPSSRIRHYITKTPIPIIKESILNFSDLTIDRIDGITNEILSTASNDRLLSIDSFVGDINCTQNQFARFSDWTNSEAICFSKGDSPLNHRNTHDRSRTKIERPNKSPCVIRNPTPSRKQKPFQPQFRGFPNLPITPIATSFADSKIENSNTSTSNC